MDKKKGTPGRPGLYEEKKICSKVYTRPEVKEKLTQVYGNQSLALDALYDMVLQKEKQEKLNNFFNKKE